MGGSLGLTDLLAEFQAWERPCLKKVDGTRGYSLASICACTQRHPCAHMTSMLIP